MVFQSTFLQERLRVVCAWSGPRSGQKSNNIPSRRIPEPNRTQQGLTQLSTISMPRYNVVNRQANSK